MKSLFVTAATILALGTAQLASKEGIPYSPDDVAAISALRAGVSTTSCEVYQDFDAKFDYCPDGYVSSFGYPYCSQYLKNYDEFENKEWQNSVRTCL